jgi:drug/metabolite transporter (DMT)-like permease
MPLALPLLASFLYSVGSWSLKLGLRRGANSRIVTALSNLAMAGWSAPLIFFFSGQPHDHGFLAAGMAGLALFLGRVCAIRALARGDLSHATPILGTKTVFVAILTALFLDEKITVGLMGGAVLTSLAVALLSFTPLPHGSTPSFAKTGRSTTLWALLAAFFFAVTDIIVQKYARLIGVGWFQPVMFSTLAALTPLLFLPNIRKTKSPLPSLPSTSRWPVLLGSGVIGFQTSMVILVIGIFGHATATNVVYATRGLWAVLLEGAAGGGAAAIDRRILTIRLAGAALLLAAVALAVGSL